MTTFFGLGSSCFPPTIITPLLITSSSFSCLGPFFSAFSFAGGSKAIAAAFFFVTGASGSGSFFEDFSNSISFFYLFEMRHDFVQTYSLN